MVFRSHTAAQLVNDENDYDIVNMMQNPVLYKDRHIKHLSLASETSSAYSGSDRMLSSFDDHGSHESDFSGLVESVVDSDDEEGYADFTESFPIRDTVRDCLEKEPSERTEHDIGVLMDFMQHFKAFTNMTQMIRRALCAVMVFAAVPYEGTVVMKDGEELDSWSVILNGEVQVTYCDGSEQHLVMGDRYLLKGMKNVDRGCWWSDKPQNAHLLETDSFGIEPTMQKMFHNGVMHTLVDDCQFVCIEQQDYYRIQNKGEQNTSRHEEQGEVVMVTEHRELAGGNRRGHIVIRGTPDRLMQHLVEDHSSVDPTYVEDFLLSFRTFLPSPMLLANQLLQWFESPIYKPKATRIILLWVNNHFNDFESDPAMYEFLEHFECLLEREHMMGQISLMSMACAAKAKPRTFTLNRVTRDENLFFSILGGLERGHGIFVTKVENGSKIADLGLKRGDQILEVNGRPFQKITCCTALDILKQSTHLSICVKSNWKDFKTMLRSPNKVTPRKIKQGTGVHTGHLSKQRLSVPDLDAALSDCSKDETNKRTHLKSFFTFTSKPRVKKALAKVNMLPKANGASNPDMSTLSLDADDRNDFPEYVVKVYRADQSFKFLMILMDTTARDVVVQALNEFGVTEDHGNFSLCEVTVESNMVIKRRNLPDQLANLPDRCNPTARGCPPRVHRYYLKGNFCSDALIPDDMIGELMREGQITLLQLNAMEVAWQLTLDDFKVFCEIEPTEYIDDLFEINSMYGCQTIRKFAELVNREMFWVVTEVCSEMHTVRRMKLIKHFIKIAKYCRDCMNFNSMFAIMSGLRHGSVSRLHWTWEKLPNKYCKMFEDLELVMDPSRNMANYRNIVSSERARPPLIPIFPVLKKDLTFIHLGNDSYIDGLVNFEKLRMTAKEIRNTGKMCFSRYDVNNVLVSMQLQPSSSNLMLSSMATLKRTRNRRNSTMPSAKKIYEEEQMVRRVRSYIGAMPANLNEDELAELSNQCEAPGIESPAAVRKIMSLTDKVRPHNPKVLVPSVSSPGITRRLRTHPHHASASSLTSHQSRLLPVQLNHESSSIVSQLPLAGDRNSYIGSTRSSEMSLDSHSASAFSPSCVQCHIPSASYHGSHPTLPSYCRYPSQQHSTDQHFLSVAHSTVNSHSSFPGYPHIRRPPLPDYQSAARFARLRRLEVEDRSLSYDTFIHGAHCERRVEHANDDTDDEQVSAV